MNTDIIQLALDTNMVSALTEEWLNITNKKALTEIEGYCQLQTNPPLKKCVNELLKLESNGRIKFIIPEIVLKEITAVELAFTPYIKQFIAKKCHIPKYRSDEDKLFVAELTAKLAFEYVSWTDPENGVKAPPMGGMQFVAAVGQYLPKNDAFIMGNVSALGLTLITCDNGFIKRKNGHDKSSRANGIMKINSSYGLEFECNNGKGTTPARAMTPHYFLDLYKTYNKNIRLTKPAVSIKETAVDVALIKEKLTER